MCDTVLPVGKPIHAHSRTCHADSDLDSCGRLHPWGHHQYRTLSLPPGQSRGDHPRPHTSQRNKMRCASSRVIPTFFKLSAVNRFARAIPSASLRQSPATQRDESLSLLPLLYLTRCRHTRGGSRSSQVCTHVFRLPRSRRSAMKASGVSMVMPS